MGLTINRGLPAQITSYDVLKSFALITMIIDHVGAYLFPEQMEWRVIGRMSMPVWLFLVGYANTRELAKPLWIGGIALVLLDLGLGQGLLQFNILFTILLARLSIDFIMEVFLKNRDLMVLTVVGLTLLFFPSVYLFDYGTHALLFVVLGYLVRHQNEISFSKINILLFMGYVVLLHSFTSMWTFNFNALESMIAGLGILLVCLWLVNFQSKVYDTKGLFRFNIIAAPLKIMGRYSLEIYVIHLFIFKAIGFYKFPADYQWLHWSLF